MPEEKPLSAKEREANAKAELAELKLKKAKGVLYDAEDMKKAISETMDKLQIHFCEDCQEVLKGIIKNCK
jgi:hypothetical protein